MLYRATELIGYPAVRAYFRPEVTGAERVPRAGAVIIAANHLSASDEVFTPVAARRQVAYFAKAEYFNQPGLRGRFVARAFREFGHVPVDRSDTHAAASTIKTGVELLGEGKALGIYPEGTRSPDGHLHKFRTGVARLALRSGAPVIPVGIVGTDRVLIPGDRRWHRQPIAVHFGEPLDFSGRAEDERSSPILREVTEAVRAAIQTLSGQHYVDSYASSAKPGD
ncbi:1-acyl-sn-glycerol-3-phosphate acyltransferase [Jatrophihabitans telluris]|uniref:1-acyl-sn-glycerol-3-phosphate acyltransferase n=1 Tax=Jatrophihabitans telluris TaxID=2038343 RepID=A0ABY4QYK4_9ACTN|nr:lysophospholipid acyltransferase family protein [Jatrophihabitans telluris]UQX88669.1 1-acyl-sn-glycerol-3-phosphate acyltransferase [Jatrophihabitans telluris]